MVGGGPPGGWLVPIPTYKPSRRVWNKQVTLPKNKKVTINHSTKLQFNSSWFPHKMAKTLVDKVRRIVSQISSLVSFSFLRILNNFCLVWFIQSLEVQAWTVKQINLKGTKFKDYFRLFVCSEAHWEDSLGNVKQGTLTWWLLGLTSIIANIAPTHRLKEKLLWASVMFEPSGVRLTLRTG